MGKRLMAILTVVFFVGFPGFGLVAFWNNAHKLVRNSADPEAHKAVVSILRSNDSSELEAYGTILLRQSTASADLAAARKKLGTFVEIQDWRVDRSWAGQRNEMVWQFVTFKSTLKFDKGTGLLDLTMARQPEHPEWRVDGFVIKTQ